MSLTSSLLSTSLKKEIVYIISGSSFGLAICILTKLYLNRQQRRQIKKLTTQVNNNSSKSKYRKLLKKILKIKGGEIVLAAIIQTVATDVLSATILGGFSGLLAYIITESPSVALDASIIGLYRRALMPVNAGIIIDLSSELVCEESMKYFITALQDNTIPYEAKKAVLERYFSLLNLNSNSKRLMFVTCMASLLVLFTTGNFSAFYLLLEQLHNEYLNGKISKTVYRAIIRLLKRKGISVGPTLID